MAHEVAQREDVAAQQPAGVELLEPRGIDHVGLFVRHSFDVLRVDQADFDAGILELRAGA